MITLLVDVNEIKVLINCSLFLHRLIDYVVTQCTYTRIGASGRYLTLKATLIKRMLKTRYCTTISVK